MTSQKETIQIAVYESVKKALLNGEFKPGQRVIERELCESLEVSRTPVREALNRLVMEGLLENQAYKGILVPRLNVKSITDLVEVREVMEGLAARKAAENITKEGIKKLRAILDDSYKAMEDDNIRELVHINDELHNTIVEISDNQFVKETLQRLKYRIILARSTSLAVPFRPEDTIKEHIEIINAIEQKDSESAEIKAKQHIINAGKVAIKALEESSQSFIQPIRENSKKPRT
ncbi:GntR family transcriptional regulator [Halalkalibacter alkaliphilus]|uniref:GntR family transcriptional regulator n=1 Tax=Halalkalibacter alkaliphilus TaxID=2917993 RepID=A0A9X2CVV8_9BACI|nr:GntR family transcriptional regulator [Halalkalibacter alkaliphilus]MCL7749232.1 GntR family transcriptional regulator [Halalkalibacter alkaliphilus]